MRQQVKLETLNLCSFPGIPPEVRKPLLWSIPGQQIASHLRCSLRSLPDWVKTLNEKTPILNLISTVPIISTFSVTANMGSVEWKNPAQSISVTAFVPHPQYNDQTYDYDYAVITLASEATLDANVGSANWLTFIRGLK